MKYEYIFGYLFPQNFSDLTNIFTACVVKSGGLLTLSKGLSNSFALLYVSEETCFYNVSLLTSRQTPELKYSRTAVCYYLFYVLSLYICRPTPTAT